MKLDLTPILKGRTIGEYLVRYLKIFLVFLLVFYHTYPTALDVMGRSFIVPAAAIGFLLYCYNRFPFKEVPRVLFFFILILFWGWVAESINFRGDPFRMMYLRSQMGFFFSAYFICYVLFNVHKNPRFEVIVGYLASTVFVQCVITVLMNRYPEVNDFFYSLMQHEELSEGKKDALEKVRLIGYGSALFGGGMIAGMGLIMQMYLIAKQPMTHLQTVLMTIVYCFTFFIGLFTARTVIIGASMSVVLFISLNLICKDIDREQSKKFVIYSMIAFILGGGIAAAAFPEYTEWAFEMWYNFRTKGTLSTASSDTLKTLFQMPSSSFSNLFFGTGRHEFWGNDMGYTRLLFYFGFIGTIFYFLYMFVILYSVKTKDIGANLLILVTIFYAIALNVKGFTDLNSILYLFFFFFLFYKYYRYYPNLYLQGMLIRKDAKYSQLNSR